MSRLPVRIRVTLAFAGVMALVLAATGLFVYLRLGAELDATIDRGLHSRAAVSRTDSPRAARAALTSAELARARREPVTVERVLPGDDDLVRMLAVPKGGGRTVVVGESTESRGDALENLAGLLLAGGPVALLLASLAGYGATAAALRPVERMRRRAAAIQAAEPGARLPVPPAGDEIRRLGETLNGMLARLEAAFARERAFVADASHELRTPLAILKTELELALKGAHGPDDLERALRSAAEETDRLVQLAEDLLVIARSDQGRLAVREDDVAAADVLAAVRERFARRAAETQATVDVQPPGDLRLRGDPLRLEQALGNLVDNALRHGGRRIELAAAATDGRVELHVRDDGPGFPPELLAGGAFERFTRADPARGRGGAGLGLAIVAAIAGAHAGGVGARNRETGGADVWLAVRAS